MISEIYEELNAAAIENQRLKERLDKRTKTAWALVMALGKLQGRIRELEAENARLRVQLVEAGEWEPVVAEGGQGMGYYYRIEGQDVVVMAANVRFRFTLPPYMKIFRTFDMGRALASDNLPAAAERGGG